MAESNAKRKQCSMTWYLRLWHKHRSCSKSKPRGRVALHIAGPSVTLPLCAASLGWCESRYCQVQLQILKVSEDLVLCTHNLPPRTPSQPLVNYLVTVCPDWCPITCWARGTFQLYLLSFLGRFLSSFNLREMVVVLIYTYYCIFVLPWHHILCHTE